MGIFFPRLNQGPHLIHQENQPTATNLRTLWGPHDWSGQRRSVGAAVSVAPAWRVCWTAPWAVLSPDSLCVHSSASDTLGRWGFRGEVPGGGFGQRTRSPPPPPGEDGE